MNTVTPGTVAEVLTTRGTNVCIIMNVREDTFTGYLVQSQNRTNIFDEIDAPLDSVIWVNDDERAVVIPGEDLDDAVIIYRDGDDMTVSLNGHTPREVKTLEGAFTVAERIMRNETYYINEDALRQFIELRESVLTPMYSEMLGL